MAGPARRSILSGYGALAFVLVASIQPLPAHGDDWSIRRERPTRAPARSAVPRRATPRAEEGNAAAARPTDLLERYRRVLGANPGEAFALERFLELHRERDGNLDGLVAALEADVESSATYSDLMILGHVYAAQERREEAVGAYGRAAEVRPKDPLPYESTARVHLREGNLEAARRQFDRALERTGTGAARAPLLREVGSLAIRLGDFEAARDYFGQLTRGAGEHLYAKSEYARALAAAGHHERAAEEYDRVLRTLAGDGRVVAPLLRDRGRAELDAGHFDRAIETLGRALRAAPARTGLRHEIAELRIEAYRRAERLPELVTELERGPGGFERSTQLAVLYEELGRSEDALAANRAALSANPRDIETRLRIVRISSRLGRLADVVTEYRALVRLHPREPRFVVELAQFLTETGQREEALRLAEQTERQHPRDAGVHRALAELYVRWGDEARSARAMRTLARLEPNDPTHLVTLGAQELAEGRRDAALAIFRRILTTETDRARAQATLGGVLADHDLLDEAERAYREALKLGPDEADYVRGLASVLERPRPNESPADRRDRDLEAARLWERVLELDPKDQVARREARQRIVGIWARRRELKERIAVWEREFDAQPPRLDAGRFLAEAYLRERPRRLDEADRVLGRIVEKEPGDLESLLALERVRTARGDLPGAITILEKLVVADPKRAATYFGKLSEYALALYRDDDALRFAEATVERNPKDAAAHRRVGDLHRARQEFDAAIASYRRAAELDPQLVQLYFDLGDLHLARGELVEADRLYRRVLHAGADEELVARALRASFQIHLGAGTLETLETELLPLAIARSARPMYRRLLVELYDALARPKVARVAQGGEGAKVAEKELVALGQRAIRPLLEALADAQPAQRRLAIELLAHVRNPHAVGPLLAFAEREGEVELRAIALTAAGDLASPALLARFAPFVRGPERRLREAAIGALAGSTSPVVLPSLREFLEHSDPTVRAYAALGIGRLRDESASRTIEALARDDRSFHVQAAAVWALGRFDRPSRITLLTTLLRTRTGLVARAAIGALAGSGEAAREALAEALFDPDRSLRTAAASALRRLDSPSGESVPFVFGRTLVETLERLVAAVDEPAELPALENSREAILSAAADALGGPIERAETALALLEASEGPPFGILVGDLERLPAETRSSFTRELTSWRSALGSALAQAAKHPASHVRERALRLLARSDPERAEPLLLAAIEDADPDVQRAAIESLGRDDTKFASAAGPLVEVLRRSPHWALRMRAASALGRLGERHLLSELAHALERDAFAFVRSEAALAAGRLGGREAEALLTRVAATDPDRAVRAAARTAILSTRKSASPEGAVEPID